MLLNLKDKPLYLKGLIYFITGIIKIVKRNSKLIIKFLSSRLNIKLYDKLSEEAEDFKDL